jgi:hypothetical protein
VNLIGSRNEHKMRDELLRTNLSLRDGSCGPLSAALESANVSVAGAYVINWIPEQAEDIYAVIVSPSEVLIVEIPRGKGQVHIERQDLVGYQAKCSRVQRLKIAVAQELLATTGIRRVQ